MDTTQTTSKTETKDEGLRDTIGDITDHVTDYVTTFYKLQVINVTKKATDATANVLGGFAAAILGIFVLLFGGIALAWWLGDLLESRVGGFLAVAGIFLLLAIIFMAIRKSVVFPMFRNKIIRKLYE